MAIMTVRDLIEALTALVRQGDSSALVYAERDDTKSQTDTLVIKSVKMEEGLCILQGEPEK